MSDTLKTSIEGGIARMVFNRPEARNAMNPAMIAAMTAFARKVEQDRSVRVLLIAGEGDHFMAGGDVKGMTDSFGLSPAEKYADFEQRSFDAAPLWITLQRMPKPVVCKVRGFAAGAALSFVAGADICFASDNAGFLLAHVGIGLVADAASTWHLPRAIGVRQAKRLAFFGDKVDARAALAMGLVTDVVPDAELDEAVEKILARLAAAPAASIAAAKRLINAAPANTIAEQIVMEGIGIGECGSSADVEEGVAAFIEKRKPVFGKG